MSQDHIEAKSITLRDSKGNPRIILDAGSDDGFAGIELVSNAGNKMTISAQPSGAVAMSFDEKNLFAGMLTISSAGITIRAKDGKLGISIGKVLKDGVDRVTVFQDGQVIWEEPAAEPKS
jgi:hypothetical protein